MARIIVYHYSAAARVPELSAAQCAEVRRRYDAVLRDYPGVIFHGVFVGAQGRGFCDWEAPSADVVREIITRADGKPPADEVCEVKKLL